MPHAIQLRGVEYRARKDFAIHDLDMTVPEGTIYGFLGANGAGKTTVIRLIMGMLDRVGGSIEVLGHTIPRSLVTALAHIGYVPERPHLYPMLTVAESMRQHAAFYPTWDPALATRLQRDFSLRSDALVREQSKGETGKLMMLLALAVRPRLLILDEPTDGLDPLVRRDVLAAVVDYVAESGASVLVSSHLVHEQERVCQWVGILDHGRMVAELPMDAFRAGIKRRRVHAASRDVRSAPFRVLARRPVLGNVEEWVVRDWRPEMFAWFSEGSEVLREVDDLDLEESFVELLGAARGGQKEVA